MVRPGGAVLSAAPTAVTSIAIAAKMGRNRFIVRLPFEELVAPPESAEAFPVRLELAQAVGVDLARTLVAGEDIHRTLAIGPDAQRTGLALGGGATGRRIDLHDSPQAAVAAGIAGGLDI